MYLTLFALWLWSPPSASAEGCSREVRERLCFQVASPPAIDGPLGDPAWQEARRTGACRVLGGQQLSQAQTEVLACGDTHARYLAYLCHEPRLDLLAERDPGPHGRPWASIRMENHRDGIEDYEYCVLRRSRLARAGALPSRAEVAAEVPQARALLTIPEETLRSRGDYARDPEVVLAWRQRLGEALERLPRALP